ncbi:MAG TPA: hypothetical protein VFI06_00330 [Chitinophagaceae bacterium]|nr:hypothetical protein [Chitinophagaceae bacterium]
MMIPPQKIIEIKRKLKSGYPQGELINDLANEGYSANEINDALFSVEGPKADSSSREFSLWYMASVCFIILGIGILSVRGLWIYYFGYIFLILGLLGAGIKYFVIDHSKKR